MIMEAVEKLGLMVFVLSVGIMFVKSARIQLSLLFFSMFVTAYAVGLKSLPFLGGVYAIGSAFMGLTIAVYLRLFGQEEGFGNIRNVLSVFILGGIVFVGWSLEFGFSPIKLEMQAISDTVQLSGTNLGVANYFQMYFVLAIAITFLTTLAMRAFRGEK